MPIKSGLKKREVYGIPNQLFFLLTMPAHAAVHAPQISTVHSFLHAYQRTTPRSQNFDTSFFFWMDYDIYILKFWKKFSLVIQIYIFFLYFLDASCWDELIILKKNQRKTNKSDFCSNKDKRNWFIWFAKGPLSLIFITKNLLDFNIFSPLHLILNLKCRRNGKNVLIRFSKIISEF